MKYKKSSSPFEELKMLQPSNLRIISVSVRKLDRIGNFEWIKIKNYPVGTFQNNQVKQNKKFENFTEIDTPYPIGIIFHIHWLIFELQCKTSIIVVILSYLIHTTYA